MSETCIVKEANKNSCKKYFISLTFMTLNQDAILEKVLLFNITGLLKDTKNKTVQSVKTNSDMISNQYFCSTRVK